MFLFAGHSDKPLKSLISIAHKENNIFLFDLIIINAMPATIMYPINEITDDSIPNSPPVIACKKGYCLF